LLSTDTRRHGPGAIGRLARLALAGSLAAGWCAAQQQPAPATPAAGSGELRLGLVDRADDPLAASRRRGAQLAVEAANAVGGVGGRPVALRVAEAAGAWSTAADRARELVHTDGCLALLTPEDAEVAHLIAQLATRSQVPTVSLSSASALTRVPVPWLVRAVPDERAQLEALLDALPADTVGSTPRTVAALVPAGRAGRGIRHDLEVVAARRALRVDPLVAVEGAPDRAALDALAARGEGPLLVWLDGEAASLALDALAGRGWRGPVLLPWDASSPCGLDARAVSLLPPDGGDGPAAAFARAYRARFGAAPDASAAAAHDATALLVEALRRAGTDRTAVRDWLLDAHARPGATGTIRFDASGNRVARWDVASAAPRDTPTTIDQDTTPGN
jgi:branched-chain amino acid transport system substrate-binding protein